jgi:ATP-dependent RNA helicase SUPV3L1/SUV3
MIDLVVPPPAGRVSLALDPAVPAAYYEAIGYRILGRIAVRADRLERLALEVRRRARGGALMDTSGLLSLVACRKEDLAEILAALGYQRAGEQGDERFVRQRRGTKQSRAARRRARAKAGESVAEPTDSPFAVLKELRLGR